MIGQVRNGARGEALFPFYRGPVGLQDFGTHLEVTFYATAPKGRLPVEGTIDGEAIQITDMRIAHRTKPKLNWIDEDELVAVTLIARRNG